MINKNRIRLTESQLHNVIKESVKKVLREMEPSHDVQGELYGLRRMEGQELYDAIDEYLNQLGDCYVSRFYSDNNQITLAVHRDVFSGNRAKINQIMEDFAYKYYTGGGNGEYVMLTYKPLA